MGNGTRLVFNPFVLDTPNRFLLRATEKIILRPKNYAVLDFLVRNPHRLVTKNEMLAALWPGTKVVDAALRVSIQEIRKALNDDAEHPRFIETVGKSGYRFIAPIALQIETLPAGGGNVPADIYGRPAGGAGAAASLSGESQGRPPASRVCDWRTGNRQNDFG
jgi:DNA-binding winged helix-turn-helix (wHTH) protein